MRMRMEKMRERARAFQSSNNAAQSSSSYSAWEEDDLRIRNDDRHSMGGMSGQRGGYGGGSSRFSHQGQDNSMAVSSFGGQENT